MSTTGKSYDAELCIGSVRPKEENKHEQEWKRKN